MFGLFQASLLAQMHNTLILQCFACDLFASVLLFLNLLGATFFMLNNRLSFRDQLQKSFFSLVGVFFLTSRDVLMTIENTSLVVRPSIRPVAGVLDTPWSDSLRNPSDLHTIGTLGLGETPCDRINVGKSLHPRKPRC